MHARHCWALDGFLTYLGLRNGLLRCLGQLRDGLLVVPQILLAANENDGEILAEMEDFRNPLSWCQSIQPQPPSNPSIPSPERCPMNRASRWRSKSE